MPTEKIRFDWITVALYLFLVLFGWLNIYAACYDESHAAILDFSCQHGKQLIWMGVAFLMALCVMLIKPRIFSNISYIIYGSVIVLLILTLFIGTVTNGGQSWIDFGAFKLQPSEFAKFATALALAKYVGDINTDLKQRQTQLVLSAMVLIPSLLILLQHDTGSALVFTAFLLAFFREGLSPYILIIGATAIILFIAALLINKFILIGILFVLALGYLFLWLSKRSAKDYWHIAIIFAACCLFTLSVDFAFQHVLESHQRDRIYVLLGKIEDPKGVGYNVDQAKIAIGSGGLVGKGFLNGTITKADFVPEQETDFIFCTVGEEWGFVGGLIVVAAYVLLLIRLIFLAERQRSTFARFYGYSVASILFFHFFINIGMVLGLVPVIGIPLPFFSYGGSSLIAFTLLLFIFIRQDADRNALF
ncbi:MAG: rod shape-determining protein RodA [Bacteroidales bacterium]|jgi:rod shape determining protein RodA|nr:rod shape-determining protein RodA [Bacteroidales bacterium]MBQ3982895.1 rod shape-determining protein RodA [Bacteroidales bacterium]